jgi:predicted branched-subunit amino acid permease
MSSANSEFLAGLKAGMPIALSVAPFGLLFGALAVDNGMSIGEAVAMSGLVFAGASQMVGLELFGQRIAPWLIVLSIFAVNFRHVLYSAAIGRRIAHWSGAQQALAFFLLTDPQFAVAEASADAGRRLTPPWYFGLGAAFYFPWVAETGIGAWFGRLIENPKGLGLDFLLPIYFLGLVMGFRRRANWLPVVVASAAAAAAAVASIGSPWHVTLGAIAGVALAAALPPARRQ